MKLVAFAALISFVAPAQVSDLEGQNKKAGLKQWFNALKSPAGQICCHNFDGVSLDEADWRTKGDHYQVKVDGQWIDVPPNTVITGPNLLGRAHLWLRGDGTVRCFIPGTLT